MGLIWTGRYEEREESSLPSQVHDEVQECTAVWTKTLVEDTEEARYKNKEDDLKEKIGNGLRWSLV